MQMIYRCKVIILFKIRTIVPEKHLRPFMPHLSCKPKQVCSSADMAGGECMPGLIWVSVTNTCFSQCWHPCFFPDCISTCPGLIGLWIFKDGSILHECKWLLIYKRQHCLLCQFNFTSICFCLCPFDNTDHTCALDMGSFSNKVDITPSKGT